MNKKIGLLISITFLVLSYFTSTASPTTPNENRHINSYLHKEPTSITNNYILSLKLKEVKKILGRRLTLKEKVAFTLYKHQLKRQNKNGEEPGNNGTTSMVLGIAGLAALFIPYVQIAAIPCMILALIFGYTSKKKFPKDKNAKTGILLGWIGLGLVAVGIAVVLATFAGGF